MKARVVALIGAIVTVAALALTFALTPALAAFTGSLRTEVNAVGSGTSFLTAAKDGATQCSSAPSGSSVPALQDFTCVGSQLPGGTPATGTAAGATALTASGTTGFNSATYQANSCGVVQNANRIDSANDMLPRYGVGFNKPGPLTGSGATGFNGTDTMSVSTVQENGLANFTLGIWFKTSTASGAMFGWSNSSSSANVGGSYDRHLYMNSNGRVGFSTYSGGARTVTSTAAYNDNNWHFAVVTGASRIGTMSAQSRLTLYIDGVQIGTPLTFTNVEVAEPTTGFWRVGQARSDTGYPGAGQYFNGDLSNFFVIPAVRTAAQITALDNATSQTAFQNLLGNYGVSDHWPLSDTGLETYSGTYPGAVVSPCTQVRVTVGTATKCLHPVSSSACGALSGSTTLQSLGNAGELVLTPSAPGTPQTITTTLGRNTNYNTYSTGLHLLLPVTVRETGFTQTFTWPSNETILR